MAMIESDAAIERSIARALRSERAPKPGDDEMLRRLVEGVVQAPPPIPRRLFNAHTMPVIGAGIAGGAVLLALAMHHTSPIVNLPVSTPPTTTAAIVVESTPITETTPQIVPSPTLPVPTAIAHAEPTAPQLFARANELRRGGHDGDAASTYTTLQQRYPKSPEAIASYMALGRLKLDRRHDASGALDQFDRYLASRTHGELREEALIGRALSLEKLGRSGEEKLAWETLLAGYPESMYADQARGRLATLGK
jgi:hypothetical protein